MSHIYDFGISQEDALVEHRALKIHDKDSLLCISSAGEVPLNMLALNDINIKAVDISMNQNFLTSLKMNTIRSLEPVEAAKFLGFFETSREHRKQLYVRVSEFFTEEEKLFWVQNIAVIENGPVHAARFEKYIAKFNKTALRVIRKKNMDKLFALSSTEEQKEFFDRKIGSFLLKMIFRITFHPWIYSNRGISNKGLQYSGYRNISDFFFSKFRDFCCSTIARENYYLQFTFYNRILFPEALPEYLTEEGMDRIRRNHENLDISAMSYKEVLRQCKKGEFNKFHLSNIGDWMDKEEYAGLLRLIIEKSSGPGMINARYIYYKHPIPDDLKDSLVEDHELANKLTEQDRYPFYKLRPLMIR